MRSAKNRVPVLARILPCTLALGCAALLGLPTSASAGTILQFTQLTGTVGNISAAFSGDSATLTTVGPSATSPTSIPITVGTVVDVEGVNLPAFETFVGLTSSTPQVGREKSGFSGTIEITQFAPSSPSGPGLNILTATFSNGFLSLPLDPITGVSNAGSLVVPGGVTFTSAEPDIVAAFGGAPGSTVTIPGGNLSLSFTNVSPPQSGAFTPFTAQNTGTFAVTTVIPEPASVVMLGLGLLGVLGYGSFRHKSSKA